MTEREAITKERLQEMFVYSDGNLYWKKPRKKVVVGSKAGALSGRGYMDVKIDQKIYKLHRLIFMWHHGYMPEFVDHVDCERLNNKIENLREATASQNKWNQPVPKNNTSGIKGVCFDKTKNKWKGYVGYQGKDKHIGNFDSIDDAKIAVEKTRGELHGQFARF